MTPALSARHVAWALGWVAAIVAAWISQHQPPPADLVQFIIQLAAATGILVVPGLLTVNLWPRRPPRLALRWQFVLLLVLAAWLAWAPWIDPFVGCPDC